jgi:hypothetical protein
MSIDSIWKTVRWTPVALVSLLVAIAVITGAMPEPAIVLGLIIVQALVVGVPRAAEWVGRKVGNQTADKIN